MKTENRNADSIHINSLAAMMDKTPNDQEFGRKVREYLLNITKRKESGLKTSHNWLQEYNYSIIDFDGWNRDNFQYSYFEELITKQEFERRLFASTTKPKI